MGFCGLGIFIVINRIASESAILTQVDNLYVGIICFREAKVAVVPLFAQTYTLYAYTEPVSVFSENTY